MSSCRRAAVLFFESCLVLEKDEARVCRRSRRVNLYRPAVGSYLRLSRACPSIDTPPPWERRHGSPLSKARERWSFGEPAQVLEGFRVAPRRKPTCNGTPRRECSCRFSKVKRALQALSLRVDDVGHFRRSVSRPMLVGEGALARRANAGLGGFPCRAATGTYLQRLAAEGASLLVTVASLTDWLRPPGASLLVTVAS